MTRRCFGLKSLCVLTEGDPYWRHAMLCLGMSGRLLADRMPRRRRRPCRMLIILNMFTSGSVKGFGFVFHLKKKKSVFAALTLLVGSVNKREVPLRFSLMGLKKDPGASAGVVLMCLGFFCFCMYSREISKCSALPFCSQQKSQKKMFFCFHFFYRTYFTGMH